MKLCYCTITVWAMCLLNTSSSYFLSVRSLYGNNHKETVSLRIQVIFERKLIFHFHMSDKYLHAAKRSLNKMSKLKLFAKLIFLNWIWKWLMDGPVNECRCLKKKKIIILPPNMKSPIISCDARQSQKAVYWTSLSMLIMSLFPAHTLACCICSITAHMVVIFRNCSVSRVTNFIYFPIWAVK